MSTRRNYEYTVDSFIFYMIALQLLSRTQSDDPQHRWDLHYTFHTFQHGRHRNQQPAFYRLLTAFDKKQSNKDLWLSCLRTSLCINREHNYLIFLRFYYSCQGSIEVLKCKIFIHLVNVLVYLCSSSEHNSP